jgi:hypothetical protein
MRRRLVLHQFNLIFNKRLLTLDFMDKVQRT